MAIKTVLLPLSKIKLNPNNPRVIRDSKFKKLVKSIQEFPEMLELRPIVVNKEMIILGGNMRFKACKEAKLKKVPVIIADKLTADQEKEFLIKDNVSGGEWDYEMLNKDWDKTKVVEWGVDLPKFETVNFQAKPKDESLWFLNIECDSEEQCSELFERLKAEGLTVKIVQ